MKTGIRARYVLPMTDSGFSILENQIVVIENEKILAIQSASQPDPAGVHEWIDLSNHIVMPGLINGHTHLPMTLFRGLADDLPLQQWLHSMIFPLEAHCVDAEFVQVGTELAALESIRMGVTTVCDMYFFAPVIAHTWDKAGLRGVFSEAFIDFPTPDSKLDPENPIRFVQELIQIQKQSPRIKAGIAPHAPYTCSDETLSACLKIARDNHIPLSIHVSETEHEVEESVIQHGKTPVQRLHDLGLTGKDCIYAHGVHLSKDDIAILGKTHTAVIYNPESNMKLSSGAAPIGALQAAGARVGIGTDGAASNNDLSIFREMDSGAKLQKLTQKDNTAINAQTMLRMATIDGAKALGWDHEIGSIEVGKKADCIAIDLNFPHLKPINDIASMLVYAATGFEVSHVMVEGKWILKNNQYTAMDAPAIYRRVDQQHLKIKNYLATKAV